MALNGRLSNDDLATIPGTNHRVRKDLLAQTVALRAAFQKALGFPLAITDSYRQYSGHYYAQVETFLRYYTRTPQPGRPTKVWNGVTYWQRPGFPMAATPGTSNHGWGTAIDFGAGVNSYGSKAQKWMAANAPRFGWYWPAWAQKRGAAFEPWHYEATPVLASKYRPFLSGLGVDVPSLPDPLEDDMSWDFKNEKHDSRDAWGILRAAEAAAQKAAAAGEYAKQQNLLLEKQHKALDKRVVDQTRAVSAEVRAAIAAQDAVLKGLVGAVNALQKGEPFDEQKLLEGVKAAARQGAEAGVTAALRGGITVDVKVNGQ